MQLGETQKFQRVSVIYGILNTVTKKWYIGSCIDMKDRFERHRYYLRHNNHHSWKLQRSYNKYGEKVFDVRILQFLKDEDNRFELEESYIKKYNSYLDGYNMTDKCYNVNFEKLSESAKKHFDAYIKTLEKAVYGINRFTGKIDTYFESITKAAEFYNTSTSNVSRVCKGSLNYIKNTVFVYIKDFDATKDYRVEHHAKGIKFTEEHKRKMSLSSKHCNTVYKYDLNNNLIETYNSRAYAERQDNFKKEFLRKHLNQNINGFIYTETRK